MFPECKLDTQRTPLLFILDGQLEDHICPNMSGGVLVLEQGMVFLCKLALGTEIMKVKMVDDNGNAVACVNGVALVLVECDVPDHIKLIVPTECEQSDHSESDGVPLVLGHVISHLVRLGDKLSVDNVIKWLILISSCMMILETTGQPENRG
jgi:hypothetical protein